jgi:uncharacterized membrane protein
MTILIINILLGGVPAAALAVSIATGTEDDRRHRAIFALIYGLWSITLAMWNWMRSAPVGWIALWIVAGVVALAWYFAARRAIGS